MASTPFPTPKELENSVERLLALPVSADVLEDWAGEGREAGGAAEAAFASLYQTLFAFCRIDPGRTLRAVRHVRESLVGGTLQRQAALARLEGHALSASGQAAEAVPHYAHSGDLYARAGDRTEEARTTVGWSHALSLCGRPAEADRVGRRGRRLLRNDHPVLKARLETNIAGAWQLAGRFDRAIRAYEIAHTELLAAGLRADAGHASHNLGVLALMTGRADAAVRHCRKALELFAGLEGTVLPLYPRTVLAAVELTRGNWNEGLDAVAALREEFEARGDSRARGWLHRELALVFASLGAIDAAAPEAEAAVQVFTEASLEVDAAHAAFLHGRLLAIQGRAQAAFQRIEQARRHFRGCDNRWQLSRADLELSRLLLLVGETERAAETVRGVQRYLDRKDPHGDGALARGITAEIHLLLGRHRLALRLAERAHRDATGHPARLERPSLALIVARAHEAAGENGEALRWSRRAVRELEKTLLRFGTRQVRILVGGAREPVYGQAIDLVLRTGGPRAQRTAVDLLSRARSPNLIEDMLQGRVEALQPEIRAAIVRLRDEVLNSSVSDAGEDLRSRGLQEEMARLDRRLSAGPRRSPSVVRRALRDRSFGDWGRKLAGRDVLLYDRDGSGGWRGFLVQKDGRVRCVPLPDARQALDRSWFSLRLTFETASRAPRARRKDFLARTLDDSLAHMDRLRAALWDPIPWTSESIVVIPSGELHALPLESLASSSAHTVSRLPHPALLRSPSRRRRTSALLLAGPERDMAREVADVGAILEARGFDVRSGNRRDDLEQSSGSVGALHVAAHGVFHPLGWLLSGMQLSDGWFGFEQLRREHLEGALVHFTSCESGRVGRMPGTEIEGWTTAALAAGAREVVLAGWRIDGKAARLFAADFYSHWAEGESAPIASRRARQALRARLPHPYYWAAFLVVS